MILVRSSVQLEKPWLLTPVPVLRALACLLPSVGNSCFGRHRCAGREDPADLPSSGFCQKDLHLAARILNVLKINLHV